MSSADVARAEMFSLLHSMSETEPVEQFCPKVHKFLRATFDFFSSNSEGLGELSDQEKSTLHNSLGIIVRMILTGERELWDAYMDKFSANEIRSLLSGVVYVRVEFLPFMLEFDNSRYKRAVLVFPIMFFTIFKHVEKYLLKLLKTTTGEIMGDNHTASCNHFWWERKIVETEMEINYNLEEYCLTD